MNELIFEDIEKNELLEGGHERMNRLGEGHFSASAQKLREMGWNVFPQQMDGQRLAGFEIDGKSIKWGEYQTKFVPENKIQEWIKLNPALNVAVIFGETSGHTCAIDIDISEPKFAEEATKLALEILGYTPLQRQGSAPKIALIYRYDPADPMANIQRHFSDYDEDGNIVKSDNGLDILTQGKTLTFVGRHHKTRNYFQWLEKTPYEVRPEDVPIISSDAVAEFLYELDAIRPFHRGSTQAFNVDDEDFEFETDGKLRKPSKILKAAGGAEWVEDSDGKVIDGREQFLFSVVNTVVRMNYGVTPKEIYSLVFELFSSKAECTGRWRENNLKREIKGKVDAALSKIKEGVITPFKTKDNKIIVPKNNKIQISPTHNGKNAEGLEFLKAPRARDSVKGSIIKEATEDSWEKPFDVKAARQKVVDDLKLAHDTFFNEVYDNHTDSSKIHIIKAPTGAGKTSRTIQYVAEDPRTYEEYTYIDDNGTEQKGTCPIVFMLPTYDNIEELKHRATGFNLDPNLPNEEFKKQAADLGLIHIDELQDKVDELKRGALGTSLKTMIYQGKIRAGCLMKDKVQKLMGAGIPSAGLCKASVKDIEGETEEVRCPHYYECPAIAQRSAINDCHVVFMPHPFLSLSIPEELDNVRCVIVDERIHHQFLHTTTFPARYLKENRNPPALTKKEKEMGFTSDDLLIDRLEVAKIAFEALKGDPDHKDEDKIVDVASKIYNELGGKIINVNIENKETKTSKEIQIPAILKVQSAIKVCASAMQRNANLNPNISEEDLEELCSKPQGRYINEEYRFWRIIEERMENIRNDELRQFSINKLLEEINNNELSDEEIEFKKNRISELRESFKVKGYKDMRIQYQIEKHANGSKREMIRISWRTTPNWLNRPMMLLDASAAPEIISKIWNGKEVVVHDISAPMNVRTVAIVDRTYSNSSIIGTPHATDEERRKNARLLNKIREAISTISTIYGYGRVVAGASIAVRRAINMDWKSPANIDWCHFGALRGLDFAKHHAAAFSIGRMELPIRTIDGLAAALTYDDEVPEEPFDKDGTGETKEGQPLLVQPVPQNVKFRSGAEYQIPVPQYETRWARLIQKQYREEELLQFVGRLRPVYRDGEAPVWFNFTTVIPEEVTVDDIISIDDLVIGKKRFLMEAARRLDGVLDVRLIAKACSDLFSSEQDVRKVMERAGFKENDEPLDIFGRSFLTLKWFEKEHIGRPRIAYVLTHQDNKDHRLVLKEKIEEILGYDLDINKDITYVNKTNQTSIARKREYDKIDYELGTREERHILEIEQSDRILADLARKEMLKPQESLLIENDIITDKISVKPLQYPVKYPYVIEGNKSEHKEEFNTFSATYSLNKMWGRHAFDVDDLISSKVVEIDKTSIENYEELGNNIYDNDEFLLDGNNEIPY